MKKRERRGLNADQFLQNFNTEKSGLEEKLALHIQENSPSFSRSILNTYCVPGTI